MKDHAFLRQLRATFRIEASEHVQAMSVGLLQLEAVPAQESRSAIIETVFRAVHSLKGAARAVDYRDIETLCQLLEEIFDGWKREGRAPPSSAFDTLYRALDSIRAMLDSDGEPQAGAARPDLSPLLQALRRFARNEPPSPDREMRPAAAAAPAPVAPPALRTPVAADDAGAAETVRVSVAKLNAGLLQAEELLTAKIAAAQRVADLRELLGSVEEWRKAWLAFRADACTLPRIPDHGADTARWLAERDRFLNFFERGADALKSLEGRTTGHLRAAEQGRDVVGKLVDGQLDSAKSLLLQPFASISASFPKIVRDLCRDQGKEATLVIVGDEIEIDKRILEEIKDPLIHLLRNCIDHGIETSRERLSQGKPVKATIRLAVSRVDGSKVQLVLADDGAGIDIDRVKAAAVRHGVLTADAAGQLDGETAQALIFRSAVSTSSRVTEVSGRGLGLAIVQEKVQKLGGRLALENKAGAGAAFRMVLPAVRATFHGVLVQAAGQLFMAPTAEVERVGRVGPDEVRTVEGQESITVNGRALALVRLADALELPLREPGDAAPAKLPIMVLASGDTRIAFAVDAILDEQEILVKPLRKPLSRVRNISGATVLGNGQVVPVLHVDDLLKSARMPGGGWMRRAIPAKAAQGSARSILVAEDSITSRMLLKAILESAGYRVKTAVDGMEALMLLRSEKFDLLLSDVEMPRLNGFDLTARIRADSMLAELPVVLVTARESREDRERGIDVGASAYLVKRSFDQGALLETVRRLL
jgi:two-component system chemotaxis sensor kinase CheA